MTHTREISLSPPPRDSEEDDYPITETRRRDRIPPHEAMMLVGNDEECLQQSPSRRRRGKAKVLPQTMPWEPMLEPESENDTLSYKHPRYDPPQYQPNCVYSDQEYSGYDFSEQSHSFASSAIHERKDKYRAPPVWNPEIEFGYSPIPESGQSRDYQFDPQAIPGHEFGPFERHDEYADQEKTQKQSMLGSKVESGEDSADKSTRKKSRKPLKIVNSQEAQYPSPKPAASTSYLSETEPSSLEEYSPDSYRFAWADEIQEQEAPVENEASVPHVLLPLPADHSALEPLSSGSKTNENVPATKAESLSYQLRGGSIENGSRFDFGDTETSIKSSLSPPLSFPQKTPCTEPLQSITTQPGVAIHRAQLSATPEINVSTNKKQVKKFHRTSQPEEKTTEYELSQETLEPTKQPQFNSETKKETKKASWTWGTPWGFMKKIVDEVSTEPPKLNTRPFIETKLDQEKLPTRKALRKSDASNFRQEYVPNIAVAEEQAVPPILSPSQLARSPAISKEISQPHTAESQADISPTPNVVLPLESSLSMVSSVEVEAMESDEPALSADITLPPLPSRPDASAIEHASTPITETIEMSIPVADTDCDIKARLEMSPDNSEQSKCDPTLKCGLNKKKYRNRSQARYRKS